MACEKTVAESAIRQPINRGYLARFTLGNLALEREVLQLFAQQMPTYLEQLRRAQTEQEWKLAAHTIKGSALAIGADRLASVAQLAECLELKGWSSDGADLRRQAAHAVAAAADEVCNYITCLFATG
jgi:HPt (histidine-containing phosphotransfer) domain-containing protein